MAEPCEECRERARLLAASEQLLAEKRFKYRDLLDARPIARERLLGQFEDQVEQARANLEHHMAEHERESR